MTGTTPLAALEAFLQGHPTIQYTPPSSSDYENARKIFNGSHHARPLAIVKPQSPADVAALVKCAKSTSLSFTLRSGGHNLEGLTLVDNALLIDLRALTHVTISQIATVQGGILQNELGNKLWAEGLVTPIGTVPSVGYISWATYGGYGPFSSHWGLGVDQILRATLVHPDGEIVQADNSLLEGIRSLCLLVGPIIYDSTDMTKTFVGFNATYQKLLDSEGLPPQVTVQQIAFNAPQGRYYAAIFVWSGADLEEGQRWSEKIAGLGPLLANAVAPTNVPEWLAANGALVPPTASGSSYTYNVSTISPAIAEVIGRRLATMPTDPGTMLSIHQVHGLPAKSQAPSVFETRNPHYLLECLGFVTQASLQEESERWAAEMAEEVKQATNGLSAILRRSRKTYGSKVNVLKDLKTRFDLENMFSLAVPASK
ncbi:hypothetical protein BDW59DRAFT_170020 [Aspergillus cavernicola]|uniref:FAD-binding PCMH-type domain-containing protein n=1 Tax=Aspergillus cavernicola TaxID=176166 RepID=A0ABR4ISZ1_9EURO